MCTLSNARAMGSSRVHLLLRRVDRLQHQTVETERILLLCGHLTRQKNSTPPPDSFAAFVFVCTAHASYATLVTSIQHDERCKEEQVQYSQRVVELRESILQRTVLIDNVNDLNNAKYLKKLANHLQRRYGPVEDCFLKQDCATLGRHVQHLTSTAAGSLAIRMASPSPIPFSGAVPQAE
jgi:hypothetical protein